MSKREREKCLINSESVNDFLPKARKQEISEDEDDFIEIFDNNTNNVTSSNNSRIDIQKLSLTPSRVVSKPNQKETEEESEDENEDINADSNETDDDNLSNDNTKQNKSAVWKYFKLINPTDKTKKKTIKCLVKHKDKTNCLYKPNYHESTQYMWNHLKSKHGIHRSPEITKSKRSNVDEKATMYYLLMFIITAALPFRCVENSFFKQFIEQLNPNFKLPSRQKIANLSTFYYNDKKKKLVRKLEKSSSITLTTDCWTSVQNFSYIAMTAHFLDKYLNLQAYCLSVKNILGKLILRTFVHFKNIRIFYLSIN